MSTTITIVDENGDIVSTISAPDSAMLTSSVEPLRADQLTASSQASLTVSGAVNGDVKVECVYGGKFANACTYEQDTGPTGPGEENHPLRVSLANDALQVLFATDGSGNSITPTAQQIVDLINGDPTASARFSASAPGDGTGDAGTVTPTNFAGGADDGDYIKFQGRSPMCRRVAARETA